MNATTDSTTGWMSEPDTRGTFRLVVSCLATLSLCVYTALHLNVLPGRPESPAKSNTRPPTEASTNTLFARLKRALNIKSRPHLAEVKSLRAPFSTTFVAKTKWVLLGMFAPELVVYTAWSQWRTARKLTGIVTTHLQNQYPPEEQTKLEWTMTHSYFAIMGGFAVETNDPGEDAYIPGSPRLHLSANGVAILAELGQLPRLSRDFILDKSKADHLAKTLVLVQAGWLIVQCIGRGAAQLPITLLEINTVAHVACTVIVYFLWWDKPLDVRHPVVLTGEWKRPLTAMMWMLGNTQEIKAGRTAWTRPPEFESLLHLVPRRTNLPLTVEEDRADGSAQPPRQEGMEMKPQPTTPPDKNGSATNTAQAVTPWDLTTPLHISRRDANSGQVETQILRATRDPELLVASNDPARLLKNISLRAGEMMFPFGFAPNPSSSRFKKRNVSKSKVARYYKPPVKVDIDRCAMTRWGLACQALQENEAIWTRYRREASTRSLEPGGQHVIYEYPGALLDRTFLDMTVDNWPGRSLLPHSTKYTGYVFFSLCVLVYGGIHASAWNHYFPTDTEQLLLRVSAVYVGCSGLLLLVVKAVDWFVDWIRDTFWQDMDADMCEGGLFRCCVNCALVCSGTLLAMVPLYALFAAGTAYVVMRFYLVLEAFLSLRDQPVAVYLAPKWSQYLAHV
ncbi:hypothetical protein B0T24DRAFT_670298 [Lasiosphaeria ovina]|uniref:Uncharacterized protein n=1 Tax=Lasiosphaeria ovina TaxID=92902 RepID=A0AAE0JXL9_9PEZI|nr:hypothetical protein B0T24DRAFT_670298 [Lasiosphaeria ovina]